MKQKLPIFLCGGLSAVLLGLTLLFRFVWNSPAGLNVSVSLLGLLVLLTAVLVLGRKRNP